jgi:hypothetical protein
MGLFSRPHSGTPINWAHPLARDLMVCYTGGGGSAVYDLCGNAPPMVAGTTGAWLASRYGEEFGQTSAGAWPWQSLIPAALQSSTLSLFWAGSVWGSKPEDAYLFSIVPNNTVSNPWGGLGLYRSLNTAVSAEWNNGSYQNINNIYTHAASETFSLGLTHRSGLVATYANGVAGPTSANAGTITYQSTASYVIGINTGTGNTNASTAIALVWSRELAADEMALLAVDPWCMFARYKRPRYIVGGAESIAASFGIASTLVIGSPVMSGILAASAGRASTLAIGTPVLASTLAASTGRASTLTIGTPSLAATLAASTGIASTATIGTPVGSLTLTASVGRPSGLVIGTPVAASTLAASIGIASTLTIGTLVANVAGGPLTTSVGIASTLTLGTPTLSGSLGAGVGIASALTVGTPVAGLTLPASVGIASGLMIGSPTASINQAAIVGMASTLLIGPPVASGSFATLAGPTQITTTLVQDGPRSNALTQLGPDPHNTFGAA